MAHGERYASGQHAWPAGSSTESIVLEVSLPPADPPVLVDTHSGADVCAGRIEPWPRGRTRGRRIPRNRQNVPQRGGPQPPGRIYPNLGNHQQAEPSLLDAELSAAGRAGASSTACCQ